MRKIVHVHTTLELGDGVLLEADDRLELSLDCFVCRRCHRTIGLRMGLDEGVCTPTNHHFPGSILSRDVKTSASSTSVAYVVEFWFAPFEDIKRGGQAIGARRSDPRVRADAAPVVDADVRAAARDRSEPRAGVSLPRPRR